MTPRGWLRARAKAMRAEMTDAEAAVWRILHDGELQALIWRRQYPMGDYVLDFVSHAARLVVEVDGAQHGEPGQAAHDAKRTEWLSSQGYRVVRVWNNEALRQADSIWLTVHKAAEETPANLRMQRWRSKHQTQIQQNNARITSSSMEEVAAKRPEEVRALKVKKTPLEALSSPASMSPPQSSLRDDSSSIEEERNA